MKTPSETTRLTMLAVLLGPLSIIPAMVVASTLIIIISPSNPPNIFEQYWGGFLISLFGLAYSYGFTILYGVPAYLVLKKLHRNNLFYILAASLVPAMVFFAISPNAWPIYVAMAYFSVIVGFACWIIAERVKRLGSNNHLNQDAQKNGAPVN